MSRGVGTWPRHAVLATVSLIVVASSTIGWGPSGALLAQSDEPPDIREVMLDEISGLELTDESTNQGGAFTRQFAGAAGELQITGFGVTTPPGAQTVFAASPTIDGFELIDHPSLPSARWVVPAGTAPGENGRSVLNFATRDHIFTIIFNAADPSFDGPGAVEAVRGPRWRRPARRATPRRRPRPPRRRTRRRRTLARRRSSRRASAR